jgi:hypothetical protein
VRAAALVLLAAGALGAVAQLGGGLPFVPGRATALGAPWLVAAFAAGALLQRPWRAAAGGAVLLAAGTIAYYVVRIGTADGDPRLAEVAVAWAAAALAIGALLGVLGALWRMGRAGPFTAAVPAAALAGEAVALAAVWRGPVAAALLLAELALAGLALAACARRRAPLLPAVAFAAVLTLAFALGETEVREAMRVVGWRGA